MARVGASGPLKLQGTDLWLQQKTLNVCLRVELAIAEKLLGVLTNPSVLPVNQRKVLFWLRRAPKSNWFDLAIQICPSRRTNQNAVVILGLAIPAIQPRINLAPVIGLVRLGDPMSEPNLQEIDKKVTVIEAILNRLETNHIAHLEKDVASLDKKVWMILGGITIQLTALLISVVGAVLAFIA